MKNKGKMFMSIAFTTLIILTLIACGPPRHRGTVIIEGTPDIEGLVIKK